MWFRVLLTVLLFAGSLPALSQWAGFEPVSAIDSGLANAGFEMDFRFVPHFHLGGAAAGDINANGHTDLILTRGENSPRLYVNLGNGKSKPALLRVQEPDRDQGQRKGNKLSRIRPGSMVSRAPACRSSWYFFTAPIR